MEVVVILLVMVAVGAAVLLLSPLGAIGAKVQIGLQHAERVEIADFPDAGDARIDGRVVEGDETLTSPISGRRCVAYSVTVEEAKTDRSMGSGGWLPIIEEQRQRDFILEDGTGRALVRAQGAQLAVHQDEHQNSGYLDEPTPLARKLLLRHGKKAEGLIFSRRLRYKEGVIEEGEFVAVRGHGSWEPEPNPDPEAYASYRGQPKRLVMTKPAQGDLYISDDPELFHPTL